MNINTYGDLGNENKKVCFDRKISALFRKLYSGSTVKARVSQLDG